MNGHHHCQQEFKGKTSGKLFSVLTSDLSSKKDFPPHICEPIYFSKIPPSPHQACILIFWSLNYIYLFSQQSDIFVFPFRAGLTQEAHTMDQLRKQNQNNLNYATAAPSKYKNKIFEINADFPSKLFAICLIFMCSHIHSSIQIKFR